MKDESGAWEEEYLCKGAVWGGAVHHLPLLPPGSRVLELGCGNGKTLSAMIQRCWEVTAIDFSARAVAMSRMNTVATHKGEVSRADARNLPFAAEMFDAVFAIHIFSHLMAKDRTAAVTESVRVLKPGGILYFSGFSTEDLRSGKGSVVEPGTLMKGSGICTHYFTEAETLELFGNLTLAAIKTERWSMRIRGKDHPRGEIQATFIK